MSRLRRFPQSAPIKNFSEKASLSIEHHPELMKFLQKYVPDEINKVFFKPDDINQTSFQNKKKMAWNPFRAELTKQSNCYKHAPEIEEILVKFRNTIQGKVMQLKLNKKKNPEIKTVDILKQEALDEWKQVCTALGIEPGEENTTQKETPKEILQPTPSNEYTNPIEEPHIVSQYSQNTTPFLSLEQ